MEWHVWDLRERQSGISKSKYEGSREEPGEGWGTTNPPGWWEGSESVTDNRMEKWGQILQSDKPALTLDLSHWLYHLDRSWMPWALVFSSAQWECHVAVGNKWESLTSLAQKWKRQPWSVLSLWVFPRCPQRECLFCQPQRWVVPQEAEICRLHFLMMLSKHDTPGTNQASHLLPHLLPTVHSESWGPGSASSKTAPLAAKQILPWAVTNKQRKTVSKM